MFSSVTIGILVALSASAWVYNVTMRRTGNNTHNSIVTAAIAGVFAFVIIVTVLSLIDSHLNT
jgi:hypothetical protein